MRYRVYQDARFASGAAAAGRTLTVYTDEAMTTEATLYSAASGATTVANPYTVPATGIIDFWVPHSAPWGLAQGDSTARPLRVLPKAGVQMYSVADYGATGDGTTDDSTAVQAAIDDALSVVYGGVVHFPKGTYRIGTGLTIGGNATYRSLTLSGEGKNTSQLYADANTDILTLGTDDSNYNDYSGGGYPGTLRLQDLDFKGRWTTSNTGDTGCGVVDWGGGSIIADSCRFTALDYAFWGINSDVSTWRDIEVGSCDNGYYLQRRSDQNVFYANYLWSVNHPMVFENTSFARVHDCVFAGNYGYPDIDVYTTTSGLGGAPAYLASPIVISDCWFEAWSSSGTKTSFIDVGVSGDSLVLEARIIRPYFLVDAPEIPDYYVKAGRVRGLSITDPMFNQYTATHDPLLYVDDHHTEINQEIHISSPWMRVATADSWVTIAAGSTARVVVDAAEAGVPTIATNNAVPKFGVREIGGVKQTVAWDSSAPASGTWQRGDVVYNTGAAAEGYVGWVCVTAGTPGTWKGFGAIEA
jgi:hypothetical protein